MGWTVYKHTNKTNGKVYIGITSTPVERRWQNGEGYKMQTRFYNAIKSYGWDGFEHEILFSEISEEEAKAKEKELIALYKSNYCRYQNPSFGYNATDGGEGLSGHGVWINQYDLQGNFIKTWSTIGEAAAHIGLERTGIISCCAGRSKRAGDFMWRYWEEGSEQNKIESYYLQTGFKDPKEEQERKDRAWIDNREKQKIIQYSLIGEKIKEWNTIREAADALGIKDAGICATCQGRVLSAGGYVWRYAHPEKRFEKMPKYTRILQFKKGELIGMYPSALEAERATGVNNSHISAVCRGVRKQAGDCVWKKEQIEIG